MSLRTGDIARLHPTRGTFTLIDRVKSLFKTSYGEYIAPEKLEILFAAKCPLVSQCLIYGDPLKSKVIAVVVPEDKVAGGQVC